MKRLSLIILFLTLASSSFAQSRFMTPRNIALGGGGTAYMQDFRSLFINPANLIFTNYANNLAFSVGPGNLNFNAGGRLLNVGAYNEYFTGGNVITPTTLNNEVIPAFFDEEGAKRRLAYNVDIVPLGFSYAHGDWAIGFATRARVMGSVRMNDGFFALAAGGINEELFGQGRDVNLSTHQVAASEISLGFAMKVLDMDSGIGNHKLFAGIAPKLLIGVNYLGINMNSTLQVRNGDFIRHTVDYDIRATGGVYDSFDQYITDRASNSDITINDLINGDYFDNVDESPAGLKGMGVGLDLGVTYEFTPSSENYKARAALSFTDLGRLSFSDNAGVFRSSGLFFFDGVEYDAERIDEEFDGEFSDYVEFILQDSLATNAYGNLSKEDVTLNRNLPTMVNFGMSFEWKRLMLMMDISSGFNNWGLNSRIVAVSFGTEYRPLTWLPLRVGTRVGGNTNPMVSFGTGLEFRAFEFSMGGMAAVGDQKYGAGFAFGTMIIKI